MQDTPSAGELLDAVSRFLTDVAAPQLHGQAGFHARVAANALALVKRELEGRAAAQEREVATLSALLGKTGTAQSLTAELCARIASGELDERSDGLLQALTAITIDQVQLDQPGYSGLRAALARLGPEAS
jgi:hypothetical protein